MDKEIANKPREHKVKEREEKSSKKVKGTQITKLSE
jgi:hypothetical protein